MPDRIKLQISRLFAWASQTLNVWLLFGHHDMTICARAYIHGGWPCKIIDTLFFWETHHCRDSYLRDVRYAQEILTHYHRGIK